MRIATANLITDLKARTTFCLQAAETFGTYAEEHLNFKADPARWSALECLEHLNRYGDFYIPEMKKRMQESTYPAAKEFKSGFIGDRFAKRLLPGTKGMSTFASMNPGGSKLSTDVLQKFIRQQKQLLELLENANTVNLTKIKCSISISRLLKLRLGDTLRVVIYHNQRHVLQADQALNATRTTVSTTV